MMIFKTPVLRNFSHNSVTVDGTTNYSDENGFYNISAVGAVSLSSELRGRYVDVDNAGGSDTSYSTGLTAPTIHSWNWNGSDSSPSMEEEG